MKKISFRVGNYNLSGTIIYPSQLRPKNPAILFLHGWTSSVNKYIDRAKPLVDLGYIVLVFGMRGHGESEGDIRKVSRQDNLEDCLAAFDFLASQPHVDKEKIAVVGSSYGGYLACLLSSKRQVWKLALKAPALYPDDEPSIPTIRMRERVQNYWKSPVPTKNNQALTSIANFNGEILLIECGKDEIIPHQTIENYLHAVKNKGGLAHVVIKDSDHACTRPEWEREFLKILKEWFRKFS